MPNTSSRAAALAVMLLLPGASASALTCVDDPARAETLAREAQAIVRARVTALPLPAAPGDAQAEGGANAALLAFGAPPVVRVLEVEVIETLKGEAPAGVFRARFLERACAPLPADGERVLYLVHEDEGWRALGAD